MKKSLRGGLFVGVVGCVLAASVLTLNVGKAAGVGKAGAQAAASPTPQAAATPQVSATPVRDEKLWRRALALQKKAIVVDGHNDIPTVMVDEG